MRLARLVASPWYLPTCVSGHPRSLAELPEVLARAQVHVDLWIPWWSNSTATRLQRSGGSDAVAARPWSVQYSCAVAVPRGSSAGRGLEPARRRSPSASPSGAAGRARARPERVRPAGAACAISTAENERDGARPSSRSTSLRRRRARVQPRDRWHDRIRDVRVWTCGHPGPARRPVRRDPRGSRATT